MATYRSAQGKMVDMASLASRYQKTRAVGNMSVNARGDTIDSYGRVIQPVTEKVSDNYSKTVGNRSAQVKQKPKSPTIQEELTDYERELNQSLQEDEMDIEVLKNKENGKE